MHDLREIKPSLFKSNKQNTFPISSSEYILVVKPWAFFILSYSMMNSSTSSGYLKQSLFAKSSNKSVILCFLKYVSAFSNAVSFVFTLILLLKYMLQIFIYIIFFFIIFIYLNYIVLKFIISIYI